MRLVFLNLFILFLSVNLFCQTSQKSAGEDIFGYSKQLEDRYIIELNSRPADFRNIEKEGKRRYKANGRDYIRYRKDQITASQKKVDTEQSDFLKEFSKTDRQARNSGIYKKKIIRRYKSAFNGFAVEADSLTIKRIRKMPNVKRVVNDRIIKITDNSSNEVIGATQVWEQTGATGRNILIGILDTGVDPEHPDLKGKVLKGYDFVNNDADAFDDHGHGTHCAGIAAANGPGLKGVAPDALILPVKVLNASGSGSWSDIISGVNYAIDPDGNALTDDGAKILSLSIGGPGSPDDPLAQAIDNAFEKNVLCVVAAGNNGNTYYNIGSPGCAEKALTVGATDNNDNLASFSSCGPVKGSFQVKPEVLAPGVNIYSSIPGGKYISWSGTSMATPHVAGAAALLMELHPGWSPSEIKAALMVTARNIGEDIWKQGKGRIDVLKAARVKAVINPDIISFGSIDDSFPVWSKSQLIKVINMGGVSKDYSIHLIDNIPSGISISYPANIHLTDSVSMTISVSINLSQFQFNSSIPSAYQNKLLFISSADSIIVPFVINKAYSAKISFDKTPDALYVHNTENIGNMYYPGDSLFLLPVENPGNYYFIACFDNYSTYVIKENLSLTRNTRIKISSTEAKNVISFSGIDQNGDSIPICVGTSENLIFKGSTVGLKFSGISFYSDDYTTKTLKRRISDLSDKYQWDLEYMSMPVWNESRKAYFFPFEFSKGITQSKNVSNSKADFLTVTRQFPSSFSGRPVYLNYNYETIGNVGSYGNEGFDYKEWKGLEDGNLYTDYVLPYPGKEYQLRGVSYYSLKERKSEIEERLKDSIVFVTGNEVFFNKDTLTTGNSGSDNELVPVSNKAMKIKYGILPTHYLPAFNTTSEKIMIAKRGPAFYNASFDLLPGIINYTVSNKDGSSSTGFLYNDIYGKTSVADYYENTEMPFNANVKKFEFSAQTGKLDNLISTSKATHYRISSDFYHCVINNFIFREDGVITDHLRNGKNNVVEIKSILAKSIQFYIKRAEDSSWKNIHLVNDSGVATQWNGVFPSNLRKGYYNARVIAVNPLNDSLVYSVDPAFVIYSDSCNLSDNSVTYPVVTLVSSDADNRVCMGEKTILTAAGANMYEWSTKDDGNSITVSSPGTYTVTGTNLGGCKNTASVTLVANPVYSITENKSICQGGNYLGHSQTGSFVRNLTSVWGCDSIVSTNLTVNPVYNLTEDKVICRGESYKGHSGSGIYFENLKTKLGCDSLITLNLTVNNIPAAPVISSANGAYHSNVADGNQWFCNDILIENATGTTIVPSVYGTYYSIVTAGSCSSAHSNILEFGISGVASLSAPSKIDLYPNPTSGIFEIVMKESPADKYKVLIFNNTGSSLNIKVIQKNANIMQVDLSGYPAGIYLVRILNTSENYQYRIIKM